MNTSAPLKLIARAWLVVVLASLIHYSFAQQQQVAEPEGCTADHSLIAEIVNTFGCRLTSIIGGSDNLFYSPFSLSVTLAMAYLGAGGKTAKQMEEALGYSLPGNTTVHQLFHEKLFSLENHTEEYKLLVANALFAQTGYTIRQEFVDALKREYTANVINVDFASAGIETMQKLNEWTYNHTEGKIEKILDSPLDAMTKLVLMNAIYFKGFWKHPFDKRFTRESTFYLNDGTEKRVPFMEFKRKMAFYEDDETEYSFLELDYQGDHISMLVMLPYERQAVPDLTVTNDLLCRVRSNLRNLTVAVLLPKFQMAYERELSTDMEAMGVVDLFDETRANLTVMRPENDLFVSLFFHKAVIDVNEQGTEAAAVSGMVFTSRSGYVRYGIFRADHPFLFCILDKRSDTILFMGRLSEP